MSYSVVTINSNIDMDVNSYTGYNYFLVDCSSNNVTIQLTSSVWDGYTFIFQRVDTNSSNTLTLSAKTGTTINGSSSVTCGVKTYNQIVNYSSDWKCPSISYN